MPGGELAKVINFRVVEEALAQASEISGYTFNVSFEKVDGDPRAQAIAMHAGTEDPDNTVLVALDPGSHTLEIVTGRAAQRTLLDSECQFAVATMLSSFRNGDLTGGLHQGIAQLGEAARSLPVRHARDASDF